ncbi:MAG: hypothetical protein IKG23_02160 [Clostridia bacterium]|jgi:hypothetical protein|nr:hypothetical protein [Clostridia bacterium]
MEKRIRLVMQETKDIDVYVNDDKRLSILSTNRKINAEDIFTILDHHNGDSYSIVSENAEERDSKVLKFFCGLFEDIVKKITK